MKAKQEPLKIMIASQAFILAVKEQLAKDRKRAIKNTRRLKLTKKAARK